LRSLSSRSSSSRFCSCSICWRACSSCLRASSSSYNILHYMHLKLCQMKFLVPWQWRCCRTTKGTTILSNMKNYFPSDTVPHPPKVWPFSNTLCLMQYQNEFVDRNKIILLWRILVIHVWYNDRQTHSSTRLVIQQFCITYWHYLA
jgi:hypothetical protein